MQYKNTDKTIPQIGDELGVEYILEGTLLWDKSGDTDRVRITAQLIKVADDFHVWAENIERPMTKLFVVQADIATRIAEALNVTLLEPERRAVEAMPTDNLDAYHAYLRGLEYAGHPDRTADHCRLAADMFERAVQLDLGFAQAHAWLARMQTRFYHFGFDRSMDRLDSAKACIDRALALDPALPEAYVALGRYYYGGFRDYDQALRAYATAERSKPNDAVIHEVTGYVLYRQGKWNAAIDRLLKAHELNPQAAHLLMEIASTYDRMRRYADAEDYYHRSLALAPDQEGAYAALAWVAVLRDGDLQKARSFLLQMPRVQGEWIGTWMWFWLELCARDYQAALRHLTSFPGETIEGQAGFAAKAQLVALVYRFMGEAESALAEFATARALLEEQSARRPDDYRIHASLGVVYAGLGHKTEAIREGKLAVELMPVSKDAILGPVYVENLAMTYILLGEHDAAIDQLEYLLSIPCDLSVEFIRLNPGYDDLRDHPRFQALLEKGHTVF
jgi:tetratricopeptide (TPR) repeat protein